MSTNRKTIPRDVEARVLRECRRRCCLCQVYDHDDRQKEGQIAHIDRDAANSVESNLAFLCLPHHAQYDSTHSQSKGWTESELREAKEEALNSQPTQTPGDPGMPPRDRPSESAPRTVFDQRGSQVGTAINVAGDGQFTLHLPSPPAGIPMPLKHGQGEAPVHPSARGPEARGTEANDKDPETAPARVGVQLGRDGPDSLCVIYARIAGLEDLAADEIAGCQEVLVRLGGSSGTSGFPGFHSHQSSVYGRIYFVPEAYPAIQAAQALLGKAAQQGVRLSIAVSGGRLEPTNDLGLASLAGPPISIAARLAALPEAMDRVVVDEPVYQAVRQQAGGREITFDELKQGRVKKTLLGFRVLRIPPTATGSHPPRADYSGPREAHVVVFDIAGFSTQDADGQWEVVSRLRRRVMEVSAGYNLQARVASKTLWYAPAGDGGALVFLPGGGGGAAALGVAEKLAALCRDYVELRVAVATGLIAVVGDALPVGTGILRADRCSAYPPPGKVCVDRDFWERTVSPAEKKAWEVVAVPADAQALILWPIGTGPAPDPAGIGSNTGTI